MAEQRYKLTVQAAEGAPDAKQTVTGESEILTAGAPPLTQGEVVTIIRGDVTPPVEPSGRVMSPYGSTTKAGQPVLTDNLLSTWEIKFDRTVWVDAVDPAPAIPADGGYADLLLWHSDAKIYAEIVSINGPTDPDNGWWVKVPGTWTQVAGDPRGGSTDPFPHPQMSPYSSETAVGGPPLIDNNGIPWALRAGDKRVMRNNVPIDGWSAADKLLWWSNNKIYADAGGYGWYVENGAETGFDSSSDPRLVISFPDPPVDPLPPPSGGVRQQRGGWIFPIEWAAGVFAIDFAKREIYVIGHDQTNDVHICDLPATMGTGAPADWPKLIVKKTIPKYWHDPADEGSYANGAAFFRGKFWVSPKTQYASSPASQGPLTLFALDGETMPLNLPRQKFSGFVKRAGQEPLIGGGGYASGQTSCSGPSLATMDGQRLIEYGWPEKPGANMEFWNDRAPREPNYWVIGHADSWVGWEPRTINGVRVGRWASDNLMGGGLMLPDGIKYWPIMGIGELNYYYQSTAFALSENLRTYEYTYNKDTYQFESYQMVGMGYVRGQEVAPDGTVYLSERWIAGGNYAAISVWR